MLLSEGAGGTWVIGASLFSGSSDLQATSSIGDGIVATDAHGAGVTATWNASGSFYSDLQLEFSRFESDISSSTLGLLASGVEGKGRFASIDWQHGRGTTSLFGEVNAIRGIGGGDLSGMSGTAGLRLSW